MAKFTCGECSSRLKSGWKFCSGCGESIEWTTSEKTGKKKAPFITYCGYAAVIVLVIAPIFGIYHQRDADLLSRLKNQAVLAWTEDTTSEVLQSAGEYAPEQAIVTATGSCTIWIYPSEKEAVAALDNYINLNAEFSAAWSGVEDGKDKGVILWTLENNSFCSEEAAHYLEWKLEE
jgi:predicted nucleic acid-binding Zn ribbon protein